MYLQNPMAIINVRLDPDDAQKARALRLGGTRISALVRKAIRDEYARRADATLRSRRRSEVVARVIAEIPVVGTGARKFALDDRRAVRKHIAGKLRGTR